MLPARKPAEASSHSWPATTLAPGPESATAHTITPGVDSSSSSSRIRQAAPTRDRKSVV